jgi:drug/metabolite transporter (DMT)-like permease
MKIFATNGWFAYSLVTVACWGAVGLLQKLGTNRISSRSVLIWVVVGFLVLIPFLPYSQLSELSEYLLFIGVLSGFLNGLGSWFLFLSLESGAKASVAVPLTGLFPLITAFLGVSILGERPSPLEWAGVSCALLGGIMLSRETEPASDHLL